MLYKTLINTKHTQSHTAIDLVLAFVAVEYPVTHRRVADTVAIVALELALTTVCK